MRIIKTQHVGNLRKGIGMLPDQFFSFRNLQIRIVFDDGAMAVPAKDTGDICFAVIEPTADLIHGNLAVNIVV